MFLEQRRYEQSLIPTAEDLRRQRQILDLRRALNDPPLTEILNGDALNTLLKNVQELQSRAGWSGVGPTVLLDREQLDRVHVTGGGGGSVAAFGGGKLKWPYALRGEAFDPEREKVQELVSEAVRQATDDALKPATVRELKAALARMSTALDKAAPDLELTQIIAGRRYLDELADGVRALQDPNVGNYLSKKWSAKGRDVGELVQNMTRQGLRFAPAVRGDEGAYRSLHQALVAYNVNLNQQLARR
jgi:hypothetical protein